MSSAETAAPKGILLVTVLPKVKSNAESASSTGTKAKIAQSVYANRASSSATLHRSVRRSSVTNAIKRDISPNNVQCTRTITPRARFLPARSNLRHPKIMNGYIGKAVGAYGLPIGESRIPLSPDEDDQSQGLPAMAPSTNSSPSSASHWCVSILSRANTSLARRV